MFNKSFLKTKLLRPLRRRFTIWAIKNKIIESEKYDYDADCLKVSHKNVSFLSNKKFLDAYQRGMDSGHKIGRPAGSKIDIHIEWRVHIACWAAHHAAQLQGDFVECGTNTGIFSLAICNYLNFNTLNKNFYLFDTFCSIPQQQATEKEMEQVKEANEKLYEDCWETVNKNFKPFPNVHLIRGAIPEALCHKKIDKVAFLHLDMNIAYPEKCALEFFWDKIVAAGVILFDDYGWKAYEDQMQAHDAFAASKGTSILLLPTGQGMMIKPS